MKDIEDEIPFDVPAGWSWCRFFEIADVINGKNQAKVENPKGEYPIYGSGGIIGYADDYICPENCTIIGRKGSINNPIFVETKFWNVDTAFGLLPGDFLLSKYLFYFCQNFDFTTLDSSTTLPSLTKGNIQQIFFPLPPLAEQQLIVAEIEKIFAQIDLLEQNKTDLQTAIKQAKSKILDLAIHGKLVPQDANDEPASVLLEKIRAEKQAKIAKGELKRDKNDSYIYKSSTDNCHYEKLNGKDACIEDELPFAIPDNWQWCRIAYLVSINLGLTHTPQYVKIGIPFYSVKDISNGYLDESNPKYVTQEEFDSFLDGAKPKKGDIIFCRVGTIGKPHIVNVDYPFGIFVSVGFFRKFSTKIDSRFITNWMNSSLFSDQVEYNVKGGVIKNLNTGWLSDFFIPIPPLAEQQRIVSKIEELFSLLDQIQTNLI